MFLVVVTGGIATGKSTVTKVFNDNGIPVIDADLIARAVVEPGKPAWKKLKAEFGDKIFKENGELNREELGKIIFNNYEMRSIVNKITHPEIHRIIYHQVIKYFLLGHNFIVLDLPLIFENRFMLNYMHKIITVTCEEDIQMTRLMDRNRLSEADAKIRISAQMPIELKCKQSHFVIDNSGTERDTEEQTLKILQLLQDSNQHWKIRGYIFATATVFFSSLAWFLNYKYKIFSNGNQ